MSCTLNKLDKCLFTAISLKIWAWVTRESLVTLSAVHWMNLATVARLYNRELQPKQTLRLFSRSTFEETGPVPRATSRESICYAFTSIVSLLYKFNCIYSYRYSAAASGLSSWKLSSGVQYSCSSEDEVYKQLFSSKCPGKSQTMDDRGQRFEDDSAYYILQLCEFAVEIRR